MDNMQTLSQESAILARVIVPSEGSLSPQVAKSLARLTFAENDLERMNELAEKNRRGEASDEEISELERYSRVGNLLNLLQSKARRSLSNG